MAPTPIIECSNVSKVYHRRTIPTMRLQDELMFWRHRSKPVRIEALKPTSLQFFPGEWVGLYGPNGSGKTTFLKILAGILASDTGSVKIGGTLSAFFELGIGFHPERQARENIRLNGLLYGMNRHEIDDLTKRVLEFADIGNHAELPMKCYSTGMRLRLGFAASAQMDADIYLFDEILAVGDEGFKLKCLQYLEELKAKKKTVILVSHSFAAITKLCDRILFCDKGLITAESQKVQSSADLIMDSDNPAF
ncbi:MAG: ABC transporter ATP-binding protein [Candidatus Peribacteraceae bacterium]|nr:ABC transporter ATP-binding protein [Candidatus Peribacteraceae bacterium]MBP9850702.1 ABC transporter ATP-binding protein [Candidatus Peribacteraceae bacterium]